ncbi:MAG: primosomal protein N' [Akkermansiaceae bacterium]|jgi:primosomal protein N' (replication factor Y)|nr:primosomal protein N' [Akkermansiaceae bacterium]
MNARVLIDGPSELVFDYAVPAGLDVRAGCRVRVPLRRKSATGTVLAMTPMPEQADFALREIESLIDPQPLITPVLLRAGEWIADYYACGIETVIRSLLPESVRQEENSAKTRRVAVLDAAPAAEVMAKLARRAPRQHAILALLAHAPDMSLPVADLGDGSAAALKSMEKAGLLRLVAEEVRRDPEADAHDEVVESAPLALNEAQQQALEAIVSRIGQPAPKPVLLLGVTGSGKTEVYLQAARHALDMGKTVLVLVPEISLTPQTVRRFKARFAAMRDQVAVLHSHLSQGERFDEWHRIRKGLARIVIGARSAVFAPLPDLGLVLVDEEHENTYKQESVPRYHGRDVAVLRAALEGCAVVLGSATPSLESWHNSQTGKYDLLRLDQRADGRKMPLVRVVDMRQEAAKHKGGPAVLSDKLRVALEKRLETGEQSILFLNRRGFARSLQCPACGHVCQCPHCSVALTYHRTDERLVCHVCGHQSIVPRKCPECKDPAIIMQGYGTQKVEEIMAKVLPAAKIARIDADAMRRKHALRDTLGAFKSRKIDILIGTQMIAKGLHFPNVTLVGILNADLSLHVPDFRAGERTFQLITQVAGRAGRGDIEGEVIVQTFTPHSPSIQYARRHDFDGYAEQEMEFRRQFAFPPYGHCAVLTARSNHERRAGFTLQTLHLRLAENLPSGILLGEPLPSPLVKAHGQFRFQITLRSPKARPLTRHVQAVLARTSLPEDVTVVFDMDALNFS